MYKLMAYHRYMMPILSKITTVSHLAHFPRKYLFKRSLQNKNNHYNNRNNNKRYIIELTF